ncbi:surfeit locus protein 2 isoform X1 [Bufo bufo]|uniref:surfeit locus protein 2 isoform X1 n=1 Tax=Bufo bufo TaxID=8384 RepID=UPI001ABDEB35|nr:surfeit locus protein 2 isoform X1 [Bufo bufo]
MSLAKWRPPAVYPVSGSGGVVAARGENMDELPEEVRQFLQQHPALQLIPGNKVRFTETGHELPCRLTDLQSFTEGRKYQRLRRRPQTFDYSSYEPHIVPSTKNGQQLFCKLTLRHINKVPEHVLRHVQGKRYLRALRMYEDCQKRGVEYVPACLQNKKKRRPLEGERAQGEGGQAWDPKDSHSEDSDSGDSMSDLYPGHMFSKKSAAPEENASDNEMEVEETKCSNPRKRLQKQNGSSRKKFKSHQKKSKTTKKL